MRGATSEIAGFSGEHYACVLWDMTAFFDTVQVGVLIRNARAMQFPIRLLALSLQVHLGPRWLSDSGELHHVSVAVACSIMAGFVDSVPFTKALMYPIVESNRGAFSTVDTRLHVDDVAQQSVSVCRQQLIDTVSAAAVRLHDDAYLQGGTISEKSTVVASDRALARDIASAVAVSGPRLKVASVCRDLGGDAAGGRARRIGTHTSRLRKALVRLRRIRCLSRASNKASKLISTGASP